MDYRELLESTVDRAIEFLSGLNRRHVGARASVEELRTLLKEGLPEDGKDPLKVLEELSYRVERGLVASAGPRYFGFVTGGVVPASLGADILTSVWDQNGMFSASSPAAGVVEEVVSSWILDLLDLPRETSVGFVTGCQMANFTCLAAARHEVLRKAGWNVEERGLFGAPKISVLVGEEAHATVFTALRMLGMGTSDIRIIPSDSQGRIIPSEVDSAFQESRGPSILCIQAGNVNTGAFDPSHLLIPIAREHGAWVHLDGAFGIWGRLLPPLAGETMDMELADSWATDAHKWLNVPYDSGIAMVRNEAAHRASMVLRGPYYIAAGDEIRDPSHWVPESSRRARGFALYGCISSLGRKGLKEIVENNCRQARLMADLLEEDPGIEVLNEVVLNQVLVRFLPNNSTDVDSFTRKVTRMIQEEGTCWAGGSCWKGMAVMRISVSNWSTTDEDITISAQAIRRVLSRSIQL
ncbi:MAG: aspartate aminotransferase family protein [Synergistales bacterium]|nr:aspartate aminotransferase family protein [Synergistales bacterium]